MIIRCLNYNRFLNLMRSRWHPYLWWMVSAAHYAWMRAREKKAINNQYLINYRSNQAATVTIDIIVHGPVLATFISCSQVLYELYIIMFQCLCLWQRILRSSRDGRRYGRSEPKWMESVSSTQRMWAAHVWCSEQYIYVYILVYAYVCRLILRIYFYC